MTKPVILAACRTAIGSAFRGSLTETSAFDLADVVIAEALQRSGLEADDVDDVVLAEGLYGGGVIARHAAITAGLTHAPGLAVNRHCAASLASVQVAAAEVAAGMADAVIAGGVSSPSTSPKSSWRQPGTTEVTDQWISPSHPDSPEAPNLDMSITVGWNAATLGDVTREEMDAWAARSHQRAVASIDRGDFADEIVAMKVTRGDGEIITWDTDEHPRRGSTVEKLGTLKPLHPEIDGFSITAGNASGINDGAAAVMVASPELAEERGMAPLATILGWASVGVDPAETGMANVTVIPKALARAGVELADVKRFEINEAFASVLVATTRQLGIDEDMVNVNGSGCSLGHPVAATGGRMLVTLIHELRRQGGGIGVASMCAGGGMGAATVIEVPAPA
ncbi:MAG: thiolase family protein [Acidimicrobiales bacterium]